MFFFTKSVLKEQWIRAKYERKEFVDGAPEPPYLKGNYGQIYRYMHTLACEYSHLSSHLATRVVSQERRLHLSNRNSILMT